MITFLKIFLGFRGTWFWACRQMKEGKTVYRLRDSGVVKFTYDKGVRKIKALIWWETSADPHEWGVSMEDVFATDFKVTENNMPQKLFPPRRLRHWGGDPLNTSKNAAF